MRVWREEWCAREAVEIDARSDRDTLCTAGAQEIQYRVPSTEYREVVSCQLRSVVIHRHVKSRTRYIDCNPVSLRSTFRGVPRRSELSQQVEAHLSPRWGFHLYGNLPTAYAVGYILAPLRGTTDRE